jgi:hypothetical protein
MKIDQNRIIKEKSGIMSFNFLVMIPRIIFLVIMLIVCVILIRLFLNNKFDITDTQAEVLVSAFQYGSGGVGYYDPMTARIYPEIIDLDQFNSTELDAAFYFPENHMITAKVVAFTGSNIWENVRDRQAGLSDGVSVVYFNRPWYINWEPLMELNLPGIGGVSKYDKELPVIIRENGNLRLGRVHFVVIQPKSVRARG